jgi:hypothetical protein
VSNPALPTSVGSYNTPGYAEGVAVSGSYAYVADYTSGLRVINISNPALPSEVSFYDTPGYAYGVVVSGNYAYVADGGGGLRVIDVSTPASPTEAGYYNTPGTTYALAMRGCVAYLADATYFSTYDISYFAPCPPPCAPESLIIEYLIPCAGARQLHWSPVSLSTGGWPVDVSRYVIYRAGDVNATVWDSIGVPEPPDTTVFIDTTGVLSRQFYQVRARSD